MFFFIFTTATKVTIKINMNEYKRIETDDTHEQVLSEFNYIQKCKIALKHNNFEQMCRLSKCSLFPAYLQTLNQQQINELKIQISKYDSGVYLELFFRIIVITKLINPNDLHYIYNLLACNDVSNIKILLKMLKWCLQNLIDELRQIILDIIENDEEFILCQAVLILMEDNFENKNNNVICFSLFNVLPTTIFQNLILNGILEMVAENYNLLEYVDKCSLLEMMTTHIIAMPDFILSGLVNALIYDDEFLDYEIEYISIYKSILCQVADIVPESKKCLIDEILTNNEE